MVEATKRTARYRVAVDIGGTFTDLVLHDYRSDMYLVAKVPSTPPDYSMGVVSALETVLPNLEELEMFVHGTTAPLNAFLERAGAKTALLTTSGFGDVYKIGRGNRLLMYDLHYRNADPLVPRHRVYEIGERMNSDGKELAPVDEKELSSALAKLDLEGVESIAICFLHSYVNPDHERQVAAWLRKQSPEISVYPSHEVCREWREYERTSTVVLNAYVSPILKDYLCDLKDSLANHQYKNRVYLMQSNGGLIDADEAESRGLLTLMSGPVGGSVGSRALSEEIGEGNFICVDMGGTSFDFSLIVDGQASVAAEKRLGGFPVLAPMVDIQTIGAGGGSVAWIDGGALRVGPRSAGSLPGPACYGRGGNSPTVTDANLVLGRIDSESFLGGDMKLFPNLAQDAVGNLALKLGLSVEQMAEGILDVINAKMANAIRSITISKGIDPRDFSLVAFGGAGPMHAVALARELGIEKVIVPKSAGAFSAWGMLNTDIRHDASQTYIMPLENTDQDSIRERFGELEAGLCGLLADEQIASGDMRFARSLDMRYAGQEYFINVPLSGASLTDSWDRKALRERFDAMYEAQYGHKNMAEEVEIVNLRMVGIGQLVRSCPSGTASSGQKPMDPVARRDDGVRLASAVFGSETYETVRIDRSDMIAGEVLEGPAVINEKSCTTVVPPGACVGVDSLGHLLIALRGDGK